MKQFISKSFLSIVILCSAYSHTVDLMHSSAVLNSQQDYDIRYIKVPNLEFDHLGKHIRCYRPMRRGTPRMEIEFVGAQTIAHNYGMGGSGWTLGPGCAHYVNGLLEDAAGAALTKNTPITIIGAGALGLFSAYDLVCRGYTSITVVAEQFENLTSHNAGGLLAPVSMDNDPAMQKVITAVGIDAYKFYAKIAQKAHPDFRDGAMIVPTYFKYRHDSGLEPYVGVVMQPAKDVTLVFDTGKKHNMVCYDDGIFIDTAIMMDSLTSFLRDHVTFVQQKITDFSQINDQFIINCTGLNARDLTNDTELVSVQGHLVMLKDQNPADLQHMILIYFDEAKTKSGQKIKRSFYMFPKKLSGSANNDIGVIGGTFIEGSTERTPNDEEFDIMLDAARKFYGIPQ